MERVRSVQGLMKDMLKSVVEKGEFRWFIKKAGLDMEYYSEGKIDYKALADRTKAPDHFISGTAETLELLRKKCVLK